MRRLQAGTFQGVCTVVMKLFGIAPAQIAYFGRKDFQQSVVVRRMVRDLDLDINIRVLPVVREKDGLALSSRNQYLAPEQRREATCLYRALSEVRSEFENGQKDVKKLEDIMWERLKENVLVCPEYAEIVTPASLEKPEAATADSMAVIAVYLGDTRLIDNMPLGGVLEDVFLE